MAEIAITQFDLSTRLAETLDVMAAAFGLDGTGGAHRAKIVRRHAARPGLIVRGAFAGADLIGFCYGFPSLPGSWWDEQVRRHLAAAGTQTWLDSPAFELTELHVHPDFQARGLGRALITEVLATSHLPRAVLGVRVGDNPARRLYASLGFIDLTEPFEFGGAPPTYAVMGVRIPLWNSSGG